MLAFLKKWRKAYLEDKGDRLHRQVEAERNVLCHEAISVDAVSGAFRDLHKEDAFKREAKEWRAAAAKAMEDENRWERDGYY
ncbi:TPA: hypothetical protein KD867_004218 [Vibrio parahaemolyticus]|nr:hypothetical protein [Vibrio parahaemolyticus]